MPEEIKEQITEVLETFDPTPVTTEEYSWVKIIHEWFPKDSEVQAMVQYAFDIWWMELVKLIECENWNWNPMLQSSVIKNWVREPSYGLCQIHKKYYPHIINDPNFWSDWKVQIDYCKQLMDNGTSFYGPTRKIKWQYCYNYVEDRFTFVE